MGILEKLAGYEEIHGDVIKLQNSFDQLTKVYCLMSDFIKEVCQIDDENIKILMKKYQIEITFDV